MMQGLAVLGLVIVTVVIYCACTWIIACIVNSGENGDDARFFSWRGLLGAYFSLRL